MTLMLTRSKDDAAGTLEALGKAGHRVLHEPLLTIVPGPDAGAEPDIVLDGVQALCATSANAVRAMRRWDRAKALPLYAVGPRTAQTARDFGFTKVEQAGGDVESLARLVAEKARPGEGPVLHVAGKVRAGDLKGLLEAANFTVKRVVLYEAEAAKRFSAEARTALQSGRIGGVLFYSPRTAEIFLSLVKEAGLADSLKSVTAYCLSANVAERLQGSNWKAVKIADVPEDAAMLALLPQPEKTPEKMPETSEKKADTPKPAPTVPKAAAKPAAKPAAKKTPKPARPGRMGWRLAAVLAFILIGLLLGLFGAASLPAPVQAWFGIERGGTGPAVDLSGIEDRLAALEAQADSLPVVVDGEPGPDFTDQIAALEDRLGRLEARPQTVVSEEGAATVDLGPLEQRLAALEGRIDGMASALPDTGADAAELEALRAELEALGEQVARNRTVAESAAKKVGNAAHAGLAYAALERAVMTGQSYARELGLIADAPQAAAPALSILGRYAETGVPTQQVLTDEFETLAGEIVRASKAKTDESWLERLWRNIQSIITIRPVGEAAGEDAGAIVARTEARLARGSLAAAVEELGALRGLAATTAQDWRARADARLSADAALDELRTVMIKTGGAS